MATGDISGSKLYLKPNGYKAGLLMSQQPTDGTGDFTFAGSTVDRINSAGVSETVGANVPRLDYQGEYVKPTDNSYYDADASTGKVTITSQAFASGEPWTIIINGAFDTTGTGDFIGAFGTGIRMIRINNGGKLSFRSSSAAYYNFTKTFSSIQNIKTEFAFVCDGTSIKLYIDGIFDSSVTPDFTEIIIDSFIKILSTSSTFCFGDVYKFEIWYKELTASEVLDRYNGVSIDDKYLGVNKIGLWTDPGFDSPSYWTTNPSWTVASSKATSDGTAIDFITKDVIEVGNDYLIMFDIVDYTSGSVSARCGSSSLGSFSGVGKYFQVFENVDTVTTGFRSNNFVGSIDNAQVLKLGNTLLLDGGKAASTWYDKTHADTGAITGATLTNPNNFTNEVHPILTCPKLRLSGNITNLFLNSATPVTQTVTTVVGTEYTISCNGVGLLTVDETGGNGRGGIVTEVDHFTYVATATSMVVTVVTAPNNVNFTNTSVPVRHIPTLGTSVTKIADVATIATAGLGLTSITETIDGVDQTPITTIPATYQISEGNINKIIGL